MDKLLVLYRIAIDTRQQEFEEAYRKYKPHMEHVPGHISEILVRSTNDPSSYVIVSIWQPEGFFAWLQSPSHTEVVDLLNTYKRAEARTSKYTVVDSFGPFGEQYSIF